MGNVIQNAMGSIGAQIQNNLANLAAGGQAGIPGGADGGAGGAGRGGAGLASTVAGLVNQAAQSATAHLDQAAVPNPAAGQNGHEREHAATLSASIVSMLSRPTDVDGNPTDRKSCLLPWGLMF